MDNYICKICGKKHNVFRGVKSPLPELITNIPEEERVDRVEEFNGLNIVDKRIFLANGYIYIELEDLDEPIFYWQVWSTISPIDLKNNFENLREGKAVELSGTLQSLSPFYEKTIGLTSKVIIQDSDELLVEIKVTEDSQLKKDQSKPITKERVMEIMQHIHHPELFKEEKEFDEPFSKRLSKELKNAEKKYIYNLKK